MSSLDHNEVFEKGREQGKVDQILSEHSRHLEKINGSVERTAEELRHLRSEVRDGRDETRGVREDMRAAAALVKNTAEVLAQETERRETALAKETESRRQVLADTAAGKQSKFSRRERILSAALAAIVTVATVITLIVLLL